MNRRLLRFLTAIAALVLQTAIAVSQTDNTPIAKPAPADPTGPMWDVAALGAAPQTYPADPIRAEGLKAVFFDGLPYHGHPTRVFAWIGLPKLEPGKKAPGIVLVHGGGGTAFEKWTELWVERGYAAIAFDTCGAIPLHTADGKKWQRHDAGGPPGWGGWGPMNEAPENQRTHHPRAD